MMHTFLNLRAIDFIAPFYLLVSILYLGRVVCFSYEGTCFRIQKVDLSVVVFPELQINEKKTNLKKDQDSQLYVSDFILAHESIDYRAL